VSGPLLIERGILLNFSSHGFWAPHSFRLELVWHPTNEHYFQAGKSLFIEHDQEYAYDFINGRDTPDIAKRAGRHLPGVDISKWDDYAPRRMLDGLTYKFTQNPNALQALRETGDRRIVEHRPDPVWGDNIDGSGKNLMGLALEHVREKLCP
jgi:ribA/ribD-fused uncharacterized protein